MKRCIVCIMSKSSDHMPGIGGLRNKHRALWMVSESDAKKICRDTRTKGSTYMLVYFNAENLEYEYVKDNGMHNDVLTDNDINVIDSKKHDRNLTIYYGTNRRPAS